MTDKDDSLSPDFESGMLVGFADGLSLMHQMLTGAVEFTAPTNPGMSAFLSGFVDGMERDMPAMLKDYHETKGLSVSLEVTVISKDGKMELIDHMPVTRRDGKLIVGEGVKFERIRRITGYLVGTVDRFNNAKRAEVKDRVKHVKMN